MRLRPNHSFLAPWEGPSIENPGLHGQRELPPPPGRMDPIRSSLGRTERSGSRRSQVEAAVLKAAAVANEALWRCAVALWRVARGVVRDARGAKKEQGLAFFPRVCGIKISSLSGSVETLYCWDKNQLW